MPARQRRHLRPAPTRDLLSEAPRSSIRHLGRRADIATVALVLVFAAFANAAVMVAPGATLLSLVGERLPWFATNRGSAAGVLLLLGLLVGGVWLVSLVMRASGGSSSRKPGAREVFCRFAMALVPLGLGMWAAHLLFHLITGMPTLLPVFQQAAHDFGWTALGRPDWRSTGVAGAGLLLQLQLLSIDAGLLLTLYLGWRMARQMAEGTRRALHMLAPWTVCVVLLYIFGFWLLVQPMQMRGVMAGGGM